MARVYNFSAGPSALPLEVLEIAQKELIEFGNSGMSVMEMSHRSKDYEAIINEAEALLRELMDIPENYKVLFLILSDLYMKEKLNCRKKAKDCLFYMTERRLKSVTAVFPHFAERIFYLQRIIPMGL